MRAFERLETEFAAWVGVPAECMVACASGTAALHLALEALRLPAGSEVVTGDFNMVAVPRAISLAGLTPVFVDCDDRLLMPPELVQEVTREWVQGAVLLVHVYGRRAIWSSRTGLFVVEDLAEAHGVRPRPETDAACWSFFRNKIIAGEEGGAVYFRDPEAAKVARELRCLGFTEAHDFVHRPRGHNYRMSNAHAGLILDSLRHVDANMAARRDIERWYNYYCPDEWRMPRRDVVWVFDVRVPGLTRARQSAVVRRLNAENIQARMSFAPMSAQEEYRGCRKVGGDNAARLSNEGFYLPVQPGVTTPETARRSFEIVGECLQTCGGNGILSADEVRG